MQKKTKTAAEAGQEARRALAAAKERLDAAARAAKVRKNRTKAWIEGTSKHQPEDVSFPPDPPNDVPAYDDDEVSDDHVHAHDHLHDEDDGDTESSISATYAYSYDYAGQDADEPDGTDEQDDADDEQTLRIRRLRERDALVGAIRDRRTRERLADATVRIAVAVERIADTLEDNTPAKQLAWFGDNMREVLTLAERFKDAVRAAPPRPGTRWDAAPPRKRR